METTGEARGTTAECVHQPSAAERLFAGSGEMRERGRTFDWAATPLGVVESWPRSLRSAVELMLAMPQPAYIAWGPDACSLYNDGYIPILGSKHPEALGKPYRDVWPEIWEEYRPILEATMRGEARYFVDQFVPLAGRASGPRSWFTFSWTPLRDDRDQVAGFFCVACETTDALAREALRESEARLASDLLERRAAQETVRQSEAKYRTLFDSIDEGFALLELTRDASGRVIDVLIVDVNRAYERHTGLTNVRGTRRPRTTPKSDELWFDAYDHVERTGEPRHIEGYNERTSRWYRAHVLRLGGETSRQLAVVFDDITERKQLERRREYLLALSDALAPLTDAREIQRVAMRVIGEHLQVDRALYVEITDDGATFRIADNYVRGDVPNVTGEFPVAEFGAAMDVLRRGETLLIEDETTTPLKGAAEREASTSRGVFASATVPLIKEGRLVATFGVLHGTARRWTEEEVTILQETAERTWAAVERARAEAALRASEERQTFLLRLSDALRLLTDPVVIQETAARILGEHLGADRCDYSSYDWERGVAVIARDFYRGDAPSVVGEHSLASFAGSLECFHNGVLVLDDIEDAPSLPSSDRDAYRALSVRAVLSVIMEKEGVWVASMVLLHATPHHWTPDEIALLQATAERTWAFVERAHAEDALRLSNGRLQMAMQAARLCSWEADIATGQSRVSPNADEVVGYPFSADGPEHALAQIQRSVVPDDAARLAIALERTIRGEDDLHEEFRVVRPDTGETIWLEAHATLVAGSDGVPARVSGVCRNVTDRKRAEAALRESQARFRAVADLVPDLLWLSGADGSPSWQNARSLEYTGRAEAEVQGWGWTDTTHPGDRPSAAEGYLEAKLRGQPFVHELRIRRHDGQYRWFLVHVQPLRDASGRVGRWLSAATDIHAQRTAREEAERLAAESVRERDALRLKLLQAEEDERRRLARELHDETGQHLTALGLGLHALSDVAQPGSEVDRRVAGLRQLVDTMGRELHALAVRLRPKSLDDFGLEAALTAYAEEWGRQTGIPVDVHADAKAERLPSAVESTIYRIVQEALTNVAKHSGATRAGIVVERIAGYVHTMIEDDGRGFEPAPVRGLGLLGIRERADLLAGTVEIESAPGAGTTIFARIPINRNGETATRPIPKRGGVLA